MNCDSPVLIYGDVMLDVIVAGAVKRMSPEAPTAPVLSAEAFSMALGGAGNVARCVEALGGHPILIGGIGDDPSGGALQMQIEKTKIDAAMFLREDARTTTKVRIVSDGRQVMRIDSEDVAPVDGEAEQRILTRLLDDLVKAPVLVISDYAKGMATPAIVGKLIAAAAARGVAVMVDAKRPMAAHYQGATVVKPNLKEIAEALGTPPPQTNKAAGESAQALRRACKAGCVVLTRGAHGLCLAADPGELHFDPYPVMAVDPTGAGDAVMAGMALAMAGGAGIVEAARFGNAAGAVAVTKLGTIAPTWEEVNFFYDCRPWRPHEAGGGVAAAGTHSRLH